MTKNRPMTRGTTAPVISVSATGAAIRTARRSARNARHDILDALDATNGKLKLREVDRLLRAAVGALAEALSRMSEHG